MGRVLATVGRYADKPYVVHQVNISVYCVEELCYVLYKNAFVLDTEVMDIKMAKWLDEECGLQQLGAELYALKRQKGSTGAWVGIILDYACFGTEQERRTVTQLFRESAELDGVARKKNHADYLLKKGKYAQAVTEYDLLWQEIPEDDIGIQARVLHNKGVAFCRLFNWVAAAEAFLGACSLDGTRPEYEVHYLGALRMQMPQEDYIAFIAEHPVWYESSLTLERKLDQITKNYQQSEEKERIASVLRRRTDGSDSSYYDELAKMLSDKKAEYREMVIE